MKDKICLALDMDWEYGKIIDFLRSCKGGASWVKIGYHMIYKGWAYALVEQAFSGLGYKVFLDTKMYDIPNTVKLASAALSKQYGVDMFNVHIQGGHEMVRAAVEAKGDKKVIGITHLTSAENLPIERIIDITQQGIQDGLDGVVCSGTNLKRIKETTGAFCVVPGIRLTAPAGDQKQIITPKQAINDGADLIVLGREVYANENPQRALMAVIENIKG